MSETKLIFEDAAQEAIRIATHTNEHMLLTGVAGTGKSTLIRYIIEELAHKPALIVAPTGIAATNIGGSTIHSTFGIPIGMFLHNHMQGTNYEAYNLPILREKAKFLKKAKKAAIKKAKIIIIDEVSMLRADLLDAVNEMIKHVRRSELPFGGLQLIFVGDMMQLPPVIRNDESFEFFEAYKSEFFFDSNIIASIPLKIINLKIVHRQQDQLFVEVLNRLRIMELTQSDIAILNERAKSQINKEDGIFITTHNKKVDHLNQVLVDEIQEEEMVYEAEIEGIFNPNNTLAQEILYIKKTMRVMTLINNGEEYFNGKIGTVIDWNDDVITVQFDDGIISIIERHEWENVSMEYDSYNDQMSRVVNGKFIQFPLKPAYAITVHKSQGLTFDKAILDINSVFAAGQAYTAVSRLRTLDGLTLLNPITYAVQLQEVNHRLINFIKDIK